MGMTSGNKTRESFKDRIASSILFNYLISRRQILNGRPHAICIELTNRCNLKCRMCQRSKMKDLEAGDMELDLFKNIIDDASDFADKMTSFDLVGLGEPLMYPYLSDALGYIKSKCPESSVTIFTNGVLLDANFAEMIIQLMNKPNDGILISINADNPQDYKWLMGSNKYDQVVQNIKNFLRIRDEKKQIGPRASVQILEPKNPKQGIQEFRDYWEPFLSPKDSIFVRTLFNWEAK